MHIPNVSKLIAPSYLVIRQFSSSGQIRHPSFEVDSNVIRDVTVFTYTDDKFYRMMTIFGIVQFFFWANLALFMYSAPEAPKGADIKDAIPEGSWLGTVVDLQSRYKNKIAVVCMLLGYMVLFFTMVYPHRSICQLTLLKGGRQVRMSTYTHFGRKKDTVLPLDHLSMQHGRLAKGTQMSVKVKGKWLYFVMDKTNGKFLNPQLFDHVVGLQRNLKK